MNSLEENFSAFMREALYGNEGFYTQGGGAGRDRDYITSPEVGDLFGYVIAQFIDRWYDDLETDGAAIVVEAGCGPGSLGASISRANMKNASNIDYRLVEISPEHRATCETKLREADPEFTWSVHELVPECDAPTLVIANELFDNLVFNIGYADEAYGPYAPDELERPLLGLDTYAKFGVFKDIDLLGAANAPHDLGHFRIPLHTGMVEWITDLIQATQNVTDLSLLLFDYAKSVKDFEDENWLRLYANNQRIVGVDNVLSALESGVRGDITTDVTKEDLSVILDMEGFSKIVLSTQTEWLVRNGVDDFCLPIDAASQYDQLEALVKGNDESVKVMSFTRERDILTDENGLGAFTVATARRQI